MPQSDSIAEQDDNDNADVISALTPSDRENLDAGDDGFVAQGWEDVQRIIESGDLGLLKRKPSDLLRYIHWTNATKARYGGDMSLYVLRERLHWPDPSADVPTSNDNPLEDPTQYKVLRNDWPYGLTEDITHLVVWIKTRLPVQVGTQGDGYLTDKARGWVEKFVSRMFVNTLPSMYAATVDSTTDDLEVLRKRQDRVLWFKNWTGLQSVRGVDHFHVLVRNVDQATVDEWTQDTQ